MNMQLAPRDIFVGIAFLAMTLATVAGAIIAVGSRRAIRSVAGLALSFIGLAGLFYFLRAPFVALMEILIYVGAVTVVIAFAIMLAEPENTGRFVKKNALAGPLGLLASALLFWGLVTLALHDQWRWVGAADRPEATVQQIGAKLLGEHAFVFELISLLLLLAIIGALVLARRGRSAHKGDQA